MTKVLTKRQILSALTTIILFLVITLTIAPIVASAATPDIYVNQTGWWYDGVRSMRALLQYNLQ